NRRAMLREAAASVLAQRGTRFELIIIDDGSTDGTFDDLQRLKSEHCATLHIEHTSNRGVAAARNLGVALARAPLLAFLDSDDLWMPDKLARQLEFMRAHPDCSISQCEERWIRGGRRVNPGLRHRKRAGDIFIASLRTCLVSPSAVIMRVDLFRAHAGFDESMRACEDYDLWLRILVAHEVSLLGEVLLERRAGHADQLSATVPALDRYRILALAKLLGDPRLSGARREAVATVLGEKCAIYANGLRRRDRDDAARVVEQVGAHALAESCLAPGQSSMLAIAREALRSLIDSNQRLDRPAMDARN
ncbi:MAG TPA: glycosyltransferase family A protein, partial [Candidatus Binataceae bacterium]|nr:glycosyltransferase family A protein [Candidatus Binataceae bacterium]